MVSQVMHGQTSAAQSLRIGSKTKGFVRGLVILVGVARFELTTPASRRQCSTRLSYTPTVAGGIDLSAQFGKLFLIVFAQEWRDAKGRSKPARTGAQDRRIPRSSALTLAKHDVEPRSNDDRCPQHCHAVNALFEK